MHRLSFSLTVDMTSRARLEQEYLFVDVMSTFLRALRAGALHIRHGAVLLAHYGRLGSAFDVCSKVVVDVLREEGMMNDHGEVVVSTLSQALREVCRLFSFPITGLTLSLSGIYVGSRWRCPR